jgi:hypothetical protein
MKPLFCILAAFELVKAQSEDEVLCPTLKCVPDLGSGVCFEHENKQPTDIIRATSC